MKQKTMTGTLARYLTALTVANIIWRRLRVDEYEYEALAE